jgi:hypothetical protein
VASTLRIHAAGAAAVLLVVAAVAGLVVRPRIEADARARDAERTLVELRREAEAAAARAASARETAARIDTELDAQPATLGPATRLNERVGAVSARAEALGLRVVELVPGNEVPAPSHVKFPIRLRAAGPADAGPRLLRDLHRAFPDLAVVGLRVSSNPAEAGGGRAVAQLAVDFEWYAEREGAAASPAR